MTDDHPAFDAADAAMNDVQAMWDRRCKDESRSPRERLAWAEASMDLRACLGRQGYLQYRALPEELERLEEQHAARLRVGQEVVLHRDEPPVRVTDWHSPWCGFGFRDAENPGGPGSGAARIECAPDPGLDDRFAEIMTIDEHGEQMLPDDENPGHLISLRELVRRQYLALESQ